MSGFGDPVIRSTALAPTSVQTGAVISYSAEKLVASGEEIVAAIESRLTRPVTSGGGRDEWLMSEVPALSRGTAWIVPLAWIPDDDDQTLRTRAGELWTAIRSACEYRHGAQIGIDLEGDETAPTPYARELVRTDARRADWWETGDSAIVLVVYGDPIPAPVRRMAVHVVPIGWVSQRRPTAAKKMTGLDLAWSWRDVIAVARTGGAEARASLAEEDENEK